MTTALPPAGWYDDPEQDGQFRWWDGSTWSDMRRPAAEQDAVASIQARATSHVRDAPTAFTSGGAPRPARDDLATAGERLAPVVLDMVVTFAILALVGVVGVVVRVLPGALEELLTGLLAVAAWVLVLASSIIGTGRLGQSYGEHLVGITVVAVDTGRPIGSGAALGREIIRTLGSYVVGLGVLWILWDPQPWRSGA